MTEPVEHCATVGHCAPVGHCAQAERHAPVGRYAVRIHQDAERRWCKYREENGIHPDAAFQGRAPAVEAYEEALDAINYGMQGGHDEIVNAATLLAQACLDVIDPQWRIRV